MKNSHLDHSVNNKKSRRDSSAQMARFFLHLDELTCLRCFAQEPLKNRGNQQPVCRKIYQPLAVGFLSIFMGFICENRRLLALELSTPKGTETLLVDRMSPVLLTSNVSSPSRPTSSSLSSATGSKNLTDEEIEQQSVESLARARKISQHNYRRTMWVFGLSEQKMILKSGEEYEILGNQAAVQIGASHFATHWYFLGSADIILGPYEPAQNQQIDVDFFGTGLSSWVGFSAQPLDLRSSAGGYGFAIGFNYSDLVGRSYALNRKDTGKRLPSGLPDAENDGLIESYSMRITHFTVSPGLFFSWLEEERPLSNSKEFLSTRIEGSLLTIGLAVPLDTTYSAKTVFTNKSTERSTGRLRGYSILINWSAILST